jgi:hypothetical protein
MTKTFLLLATAISFSAHPTLAQEGRLPFCAEEQSQKLLNNLIEENFSVKVLAYDETPTQIDFSGSERRIVESESAKTRECYTRLVTNRSKATVWFDLSWIKTNPPQIYIKLSRRPMFY